MSLTAQQVIDRIREWRLLDAPDDRMAYKASLSNLLDRLEEENGTRTVQDAAGR